MCVRFVLSGLVLLVLTARAAACRAEPCRIDVVGLDAEWQEPVQRLRERALTHEHCARVQLEAIGLGVRLMFVTHDGRYAERLLTTASELSPTVDALLVTGDDARVAVQRRASEPALSRAERPTPRGAPRSAGSQAALAIGLQGGLRAGAESLASPLVSGGAALLMGRWELGVLGVYEFHYARLGGDTSTDRGARALALAVSAGRREPLGPAVLLAGGRVFVAALEYRDVQNDSHAEGRAGAYVGVTWPRRDPWRLRAELAADFVAAGALRDDGPAGQAPPSITPAWALTLLVGVEMNAF